MCTDKEVRIYYVKGVEGNSISINDIRVAGPKPWGGGEILKMWKVPREVILNALGLHRTKERAWEEI